MRYFTDLTEGEALLVDEDGLDFADPRAAALSAAEALAEIARDAVRTGAERRAGPASGGLHLAAQVRDPTGRTVFRARLDLTVEWPAEPRAPA